MRRNRFLPAAVATAVLLAFSQVGVAQQRQQERQRPQRSAESQSQSKEWSMTLPPNQAAVELKVTSPQEVRVGQRYEYQIHVTNISDNLMLHDVVVAQKSPEGFDVESAQLVQKQGQKQGQNQKNQNKGQKERQARTDQGNQKNRSNSSGQQSEQQANASDRSRSQTAASDSQQGQWTIDKLAPGQTRTIRVTASSDKAGDGNVCFIVTSVKPSLCVATKFVEPEIQITKSGSEEANLCEEIEYLYTVKNTGTGDVKSLIVRDQLPEGLQTLSGDKELEFKVDGLKAGDQDGRSFRVKLRATEAGEYTSRAVAVDQTSGEETRSQKHTTRVVQADLAVAIDGDGAEYVNRAMNYTIRVTNVGDAPAPNTQLTLHYDAIASLDRAGKPQSSDEAVQAKQQSQQVSTRNQPTPANREQRQPRERSAQASNDRQQQQQQSVNTKQWNLGTLEPGETKQVTYTLRGREGGVLNQKAVAQFVCATGQDQDKETMKVTSTAFEENEVISMPALLISVSDQEDPVKIANELVYTVVVQNEGTATDSNVRVSAELPQQLEFVNATGDSEVQSDGQSLNFGKIDQLKPGEKVRWQVRTKVNAAGDARFEINVESDTLTKPATSEEPTQLFGDKQAER